MTEVLNKQLIEAGNALPGANVYFRKEWDCEYFDVAGKYFALLGKNKEGEEVFTVKGEPEKNELLREQYPFVVPGYYTNKTHWNSIVLKESSFKLEDYKKMLQTSYDLTVSKLSKKVRESL